MDAGGGDTSVVDAAEGEFLLRETTTIFVSGDVDPSLKVLRPVEADVGVSLHSEGM